MQQKRETDLYEQVYKLGKENKKMKAEKSTSGKTIWEVVSGRLKESGGDSYLFTLTAIDTLKLHNLLHRNLEEIVQEARKELTAMPDTMKERK